jgi:hypothetical protein
MTVDSVNLSRFRMRHTISQRAALAGALLLLICSLAGAQEQPARTDDPFVARRWHFEAGLHGALEAWNYNVSHEELYGVAEGLTYGLKDGVVLTFNQHVYYVSQRANDSWLLGLTAGIRGRVYQRGGSSAFVEASLGISDAAIAAPPRGTRFNYLAMGSGGVLVRVRPRVHALVALQWMHLSNNSLKGPGRNPDIETLGPRVGVVIGF